MRRVRWAESRRYHDCARNHWGVSVVRYAGGSEGCQSGEAWTRTFPETTLSIQPDHLGRVLAVGNDTNSSFAFIFDGQGRTIARAELPFAGVAGGECGRGRSHFRKGVTKGAVKRRFLVLLCLNSGL